MVRQLILALISINFIATCVCYAADKVIPQDDVVYTGSFIAPSGTRNSTDWSYRKMGALGYRSGGVNGILIGGGHDTNPTLAEEIYIPSSSNIIANHNFNIANLHSATVLTPFADITGGRQITGGDGGTKLSDVQYLPAQSGQTTGKYYWAMSYYYDVSGQVGLPRLGWTDTDYTNVVGTWTLPTIPTRFWDKYLLEIDTDWATAHTGGKTLGVGRIRENGSFGPSLYAIAPWSSGSPPADGTQLSYTKLMEYPDDTHTAEWYSYGGQGGVASDAAWVTIGGKQAFVVLAEVTLSSDDGDKFFQSSADKTTGGYKSYCLNGTDTTLGASIDAAATTITVTDAAKLPDYGIAWLYPTLEHVKYTGKSGNTLTGCTRGYDGTTAAAHTSGTTVVRFVHRPAFEADPANGGPQNFPYAVMLIFYDVDQIAEIAAGTRQPYDIQPYAYYNIDRYFWSSRARQYAYKDPLVAGLAYDAGSNRLIVGEYGYAHGSVSIFHVFDVDNIGSSLDTSPPPIMSAPDVNSGVVSWGQSADAGSLYVIEKYYDNICGAISEYRPIAVSYNTSWTDQNYTTGDSYRVQVYDTSLNKASSAGAGAKRYRNLSISDK